FFTVEKNSWCISRINLQSDLVKRNNWYDLKDSFAITSGSFEFNAPSHLVRPNLEVAFSQKFRTFKYQASTELFQDTGLDPNAWKSKEQILANVPVGVTPSNWTAFVENEFKEGVRESHEKKSENKKKCTIPHTLGRRTYANKCHLLVCFIHFSILLVILKLYFVMVMQLIWIQMSRQKRMGCLQRIANTLG
ncbi:hypothetical protein MKW98_030452, partial [Papaver atlanticum]